MVQFQYGPPTFWGWDDFKVVASPQIISGPSPKITIRWPEISHRTWHKGTIGHHLRPWGLNPTKSDKVESRVAVTLWGLKHVDDTKVRAQKLLEHLTTELHVPKPNHGRSLTSSLHLPYIFLTCQLIDTISGGSMWTCSGWHRLSKYVPIFLRILQHSSCFSSCFHRVSLFN